MYSYIKGIVTEIESNFIVLESNQIGYLIFVANPYNFKINDNKKIYLYQVVREDEMSLYGFKNKEEKDLFLKLINVKGLGPKLAISFLATDSKEVINAIETENITYLKKYPKVGDKVARQIILDLKGKLITDEYNEKNNNELIEALQSLGYKNQDINKILPNIKEKQIEKQIKEALKLLLK